MQVANTSKFVQTIGDTTIEPRTSAHVDDRYDSPTLRALAERGLVMIAGDAPKPRTPVVNFQVEHEVEAPKPPAVLPSELSTLDEPDDGIPDGWNDIHANKRKAWIRKCGDIATLSKLKLIEESDKIMGAIDARIAQLEERP